MYLVGPLRLLILDKWPYVDVIWGPEACYLLAKSYVLQGYPLGGLMHPFVAEMITASALVGGSGPRTAGCEALPHANAVCMLMFGAGPPAWLAARPSGVQLLTLCWWVGWAFHAVGSEAQNHTTAEGVLMGKAGSCMAVSEAQWYKTAAHALRARQTSQHQEATGKIPTWCRPVWGSVQENKIINLAASNVSGGSSRSASTFQTTASSLRLGACKMFHTPFKKDVSVSYSPRALLKSPWFSLPDRLVADFSCAEPPGWCQVQTPCPSRRSSGVVIPHPPMDCLPRGVGSD